MNWRWGLAGLVAAALAVSPMACFNRGGTAAPKAGAVDPQGREVANLNFTVKDMNGHDVDLASFRGHPIVLNFWATWCGPCRLEIPHLVELADEYRAKGLVVLGISIDDEPSDLRAFAPTLGMNYPILVGRDHDDLLAAYDAVYGIPISVFIRPDGTVALKRPGYNSKAWFDEQIRALF
jgi:thiol-disulfide isomerase/thioredoxin